MTFPEVYDEHCDAVHAVAQRVGIAHLAADVAQETFVQLWRDPTRFDPTRGSLRGYLVMVARNLAIDRARSENARVNRERRTRPSRASADSSDQATALLAAETTDEIGHALSRLNPDYRDAIVAAFYGGLTYAGVAAAFGEPEGTIKSRIRRGLLELRTEMEGLGARPHLVRRPIRRRAG